MSGGNLKKIADDTVAVCEYRGKCFVYVATAMCRLCLSEISCVVLFCLVIRSCEEDK
jgi:hypothetical protein